MRASRRRVVVTALIASAFVAPIVLRPDISNVAKVVIIALGTLMTVWRCWYLIDADDR